MRGTNKKCHHFDIIEKIQTKSRKIKIYTFKDL